MKPGKRFDNWIAKNVMGWRKEVRYWTDTATQTQLTSAWMWVDKKGEVAADEDWSPTTDIVSSMQVVEKLDCLNFTMDRESACGVRYDIHVYNHPDCKDEVRVNCIDTLPHAICLAAKEFVKNRKDK